MLLKKHILRLPAHSPDSFCLSALGWNSIVSYIDMMKMMYFWRIFNIPEDTMYRNIFITRFYNVLSRNVFSCKSPVAQLINVLHKYNYLPTVMNYILSNDLPSKHIWNRTVKRLVNDRQFFLWRRSLRTYVNLQVYRNIQTVYEPSIWVNICSGIYQLHVILC